MIISAVLFSVLFNLYSANLINENASADFEHENTETIHKNLDGAGTDDKPYLITNLEELNAVRVSKNSTYRIENDIDAKGTQKWNSGKGFNPIGQRNYNNDSAFTGKLLGNNKTIKNLDIKRPKETHNGLFGYAKNSKIININLESADIVGGDSTAALIGAAAYNVEVDNVNVEGKIKGMNRTAGIIGNFANGGIIKNSDVDADVFGNRFVGGLTGYTEFNSTIENSNSESLVEGDAFAIGGITGRNSGYIINSTSQSTIKGDYRVGGLAGDLGYGRPKHDSLIIGSSSNSKVEGNLFVGSFVGYMGSVGTHALDYADNRSWEVRIEDSYFVSSEEFEPIGKYNYGDIDLQER